MLSSQNIVGSCNCGAHGFSIPPPSEMNLCHCIDCCKWAGAFHSAHLMMDTNVITNLIPENKSKMGVYRVRADSGNMMERTWCQTCGEKEEEEVIRRSFAHFVGTGAGIWIRSFTKEGEEPQRTNLKAGLFDRNEICGPTMENWMKETPAKGTKRQAVDGN
ncbi:hypothetical protein AC579_2520 [Pseudocercospora musae]|uniref:CENP-V/GFA domain-containing protein n=1 Tax=Pseudocercospora musae TaxID=113226 RepID=A0A139I3Z3_9PEZI|nr:hypothetical protein AC579_2520 [Pseudocercospora musae]